MRVALISDIHGNMAALKAVLADLPPVDARLCAGDLVGYYPDVNEVCELLIESLFVCVRGNHDCYVTGKMTPDPAKAVAYRSAWTRENLQPELLSWLGSLPVEMLFDFDGVSLLLRHASPWDETSYIYPDSPSLNSLCLSHDYLVLGHTHHPLNRECEGGVLVNPGSVGQPRDWNPMASYAIIDTARKLVELRRVEYDVGRYQRRLKRLRWEAVQINILSRRRKPLEESI